MIPVIDLGRNNTPAVRFSFAGFVHVSRSGARASVQRSSTSHIPMSCDNNIDISHVQPPLLFASPHLLTVQNKSTMLRLLDPLFLLRGWYPD